MVAGVENHNADFTSLSNKIVRANFAMNQPDILEFSFMASASVVDISVFKKETDSYFLVVSDANGATYHYDIYDHTSSNPAAVYSNTVTPSPVSNDSRPRCLDFKWDGSDNLLILTNDGKLSLSSGYKDFLNV